MKIAFIVGEFPSLSETFVLRQITGLLDRGHEVDIFARRAGSHPLYHRGIVKYGLLDRTCYLSEFDSSGSKVGRFRKRLTYLLSRIHKEPTPILRSLNVASYGKDALLLRVFAQILPFLERGPYEIVQCHFGPNGNLGLLLRDTAVTSGKIVTTFHGYDVSSYTRENGQHIYRDLFARGDLFLCVSDHIKRKLLALGCPEAKTLVHRCGIELGDYREAEKKSKQSHRALVVSVARLVEKKGLESGVRAVARVLKKYEGIRYKIVGDGPLRPRLETLIRELRVGDKIRLVGWKSQAEIRRLMRRADFFLAPSVTSNNGDEEGIPVAIMEAFAQGVPVIGTYHAGIPELVQDGVSGFLVSENDIESLAESIERLVAEPELGLAMGRNGRKFVEQHHDIEMLNDRLVEIYDASANREMRRAGAIRVAPSIAEVA